MSKGFFRFGKGSYEVSDLKVVDKDGNASPLPQVDVFKMVIDGDRQAIHDMSPVLSRMWQFNLSIKPENYNWIDRSFLQPPAPDEFLVIAPSGRILVNSNYVTRRDPEDQTPALPPDSWNFDPVLQKLMWDWALYQGHQIEDAVAIQNRIRRLGRSWELPRDHDSGEVYFE